MFISVSFERGYWRAGLLLFLVERMKVQLMSGRNCSALTLDLVNSSIGKQRSSGILSKFHLLRAQGVMPNPRANADLLPAIFIAFSKASFGVDIMHSLKLLKVEDNILPKIELVQLKIRGKLLPLVENGKKSKVQTAKYLEFASRLKGLMDKEGSPITTVNQLKDAIDVTYEMARRYTLGIAKPREEKMQILADKFNVDISYLDHGTGLEPNVTAPFPVAGRLVPVISWVQAGSWTTVDSVPAGTQFEEWLPPNPKCGKNGYGLEVVGESMLPDFRPGDKIYVNPDFQITDLKTGDLVIVSCQGDSEATFKKLIVESGNMYLQPLNPDWPEKTIALEDGCKLVGKVVGLYRDV